MTLLEMLLARMAGASGENLYVSSGAVQMPEITKNDATGEITVGEGVYRLYHTDDFTGEISEHTIDGDTFTIPDDNTSYAIIADYNNGFPIIRMGATNDYNDSSTLGILTVAYSTLVGISVIDWGREAVGAVNKLTVKSYASGEKYAIESGLSVSVENTREIVVSNGNVFVGIEKQFKPEVHSGTDKCLLHKSTASGEITRELITAYSSTVYDNETGTLATLADDSYGVLWVWRSMSDLKLVDVMYGSNSYYSETAAREANLPTNTPNSLGNNALLLGRLIYEKGSNTADFVAAVNGGIGSGGVTSHLSLTDVQGGGNGIYNHSDQNINKNASNVLFNSMAVGGLTGSRSYNLQAVDSFGVSSPNNAIKYFYATTGGAGLGDDKPFIWGLHNDFNAQYSSSLDALIVSNGTGVATAPYLYLWENKVGIGRKPNTANLEVEDSFRLANDTDLLFELTANGMKLDEDKPIVMGEGNNCYLGWNGSHFYMGLGSDFGANDRFVMNSSGNIVHYGYTYLGGSSPGLKSKIIYTYFGNAGTAHQVKIAHGLTASKIVMVSPMMYYGSNYYPYNANVGGLSANECYSIYITSSYIYLTLASTGPSGSSCKIFILYIS